MSRCMCNGCTNNGIVAVRINAFGNGNSSTSNGYGFMCHRHAYEKLSYSTENGYRRGIRKVNEFTYSIELETGFSDLKARGELLNFGFLPTADITVDVEYKSPIYEGMNAINKQCESIERLIAEERLVIDSRCGTHLHVGHASQINERTMRYIRRFNNSLFVPLSDAIMADTEKSARFFGREPNRWAQPVTWSDPSGDVNGYSMKHEAMFNLQHDYTIEFRQAKFVNAKQYMAVAHFGRDVVDCIVKNFVEHFNENPKDTRRYPTKTAYRKHKAEVTAKKLVKLYEKYTANC